MIIFQPENELSWKALNNALKEDIFVAVHLTLTKESINLYQELLSHLVETGVKAISLSTDDIALKKTLLTVRDQVASLNLDLVWNLPVPYSAMHPVAAETEALNLPEGAGRGWLYVEPDGDVLPAQGINKVLGNFLNDSWESIWKI
jgi:MoaA/NifB/PqqE/SkfB family radical SAM enzyme